MFGSPNVNFDSLKSDMETQQEHRIVFASLGMVVLDEIHFHSGKVLEDVIGGSGAYSTLGARLFQQPSSAPSIGWLIKAGPDFPKTSRDRLQDWATNLVFQEGQDRQTTRGLLIYKDASHTEKTFEYTTPTLLINPSDFANTDILQSGSFHILSGPHEVTVSVSELLALRQSVRVESKPLIVWEPKPSSCTHKNFDTFQEAARAVDVFSPNHVELAAMFVEKTKEITPGMVSHFASRFCQSGVGPEGKGYVVVRSGELGCFIASRKGSFWSPAYYEAEPEVLNSRVVDPTGAGNAFLGAFAVGYLQHFSIYEAACYGAVGASFVLEQHGVPERHLDHSGIELWNGDNVAERLRRYQGRFKQES